MVVARRPRDVTPGQIVAGKYRIERVIAAGGQGTVVQATHLRLDQSVAIKFPHANGAGEGAAIERMFREARASFRLQGVHVARTIDVDVVDGAPFIVMEYLRGTDLKDYVAKRGALPIEEAVGLLLQACEAVAEAHDQGIIHRDLKPSNLFLVDRSDGSPMLKVLDFGLSIATTIDPTTDISDLTEPERMLGSPRYMSPEQVRDSHDVDGRSDIWSLGVILQELLTGAPMFRARTHMQALALVLTRNPAPVSMLRPDVPPEIERVVMRCLQKIREHRFGSARELAQALAPFAPSWAIPNVERMLPGFVGHHATSARGTAAKGTVSPDVRGRRHIVSLRLLALGGMAMAAVATWTVGRHTTRRSAENDSPSGLISSGRPHPEPAPAPAVVEHIAAPMPDVQAPGASDDEAAPPSLVPAPERPQVSAARQLPQARGTVSSASSRKRSRPRRRPADWGERSPAMERQPTASRALAASPAQQSAGPRPAVTSFGEEAGPLEGRK